MTKRFKGLNEDFPLPGIGKRLKELRLEIPETQSTAAKHLGIADRTYKFYELEHRVLTFSCAKLLAERHGVNLQWIATGEGYKYAPKEPEHMVDVVDATIGILGDKFEKLLPEQFGKCVGLVHHQTLSTGQSACDAAQTMRQFFDV